MDGFDEVILDDSRNIQPRSNQPSSRSKRKKHKNNGLPQVSEIQVKDPDKRGDGVQTYIVYRIFTTFTDGETKKVERRYSDFKWLHDILSTKIKGVIIPPIPSKYFLGRFIEPDFVEKRRRGLEFFLNEVLRHDLLRVEQEFRLFLTADTPSLRLAMSQNEEERSWLSTFTDIKTNLMDTVFTDTSIRDPTENDQKCDEIAQYADRLLTIITSLDNQVQALMKSARSQSRSWFELGLSMTTLGAFQRQHGYKRIGDALSYLGKHAESSSNILSEKTDVDETRHWSEPIERYKKLVVAIQEMMKGRHDLLMSLKREESTLLKLKQKSKSLTGDALKSHMDEISMSEQKVSCLSGNLEVVTTRLLKEFEEFKHSKAEELKKLITDFGRIQAKHHARMAEEWNKVLHCIKENKYPADNGISEDMDFVDISTLNGI